MFSKAIVVAALLGHINATDCLTDLEGFVAPVEKIISDIQAKNYEDALTDVVALLPQIEQAYTDCVGKEQKHHIMKQMLAVKKSLKINKLGDLATCIADIEGLIPGIEKVIADVKAGNESQALADLLALEPEATKAYTDCTASNKVAMVLTSENKNMFGKVGDLATCISDIEAMIPGVEKVIADVKAGNESQALADLLALEPQATKAYTDCTSSKFQERISGAVGDLPTCISDIEAMIPDVEAVIADFKAGNQTQALIDALKLEPLATKAYADCTSSKFQNGFGKKIGEKVGDLATCIADIEAMIPGVEKVIADVKAGNESQALADLLALEPQATKALTDCTSGLPKDKIMHKIMHKISKISKVEDLQTCIADIEAMIPDVEAVIADFKAGNQTQALIDALKLEPLATKALADCKSGGKSIKGKFLGALKGKRVGDDPKREYFEKIGAEFASAFYHGTNVGQTESIDLYNCLHREPTAVEVFYKADMTLKESFIHKDPKVAIKGAHELFFFIIELIVEDYPHTHHEVCSEFKDHKDFHFEDLHKILEEMKSDDRTLEAADDKVFFNKQDVTTDAHNVIEAYLKQDFGKMGYEFGHMLQMASNHTMEAIPDQEPTLFLY